jgi:hypothetical protein
MNLPTRLRVPVRTALAAAALLTAWVALPAPAAAENYEDENLGYSLSVPDGYRAIPIAGEEKYIVARWQSEREYADKKEGWSHRPDLKVILFDPKGKKSAEVAKEGDVSKISIQNPYKTYKDWIKSDAEGGRYISKEEEVEVHGVKATWYEVAYEKLTVPRHGLAYVYHAEDIDYCLTTEVLEQYWDKLSPALYKVMKSVKIFPRKGTVKREVTGDDADITIRGDLSKLSPEDRYKRRQANFEKSLKVATERLTDGWFVKRSKNYVALSHTDEKYTTGVLDLAEAVRAWAEATLPYYGNGISGSELIRICKDYDEERAFRDTSARSGWVHEVTVSRNEGIFGPGNVASTIFDRWLDDKNPRLAYGKPPWLDGGLREWVGTAYLKGGKLAFRNDADTTGALKQAAKSNTLIMPRDMLVMSYDDLMQREKDSQGGGSGPLPGGMPIPGMGRASPWQQTAGFVRFLLDGPGKGNARTKDLLKAYVLELDAFLKAEDEKSSGTDYKAPKSEEEEEARFKNREAYWKDHQKDLLKAVFDKVFKDWTDADWKALDKSFKSYAS